MGLFSFQTADTKDSIPAIENHPFSGRTVYMLTPDGEHYSESDYMGNGMFGDVDCYAWLAKMNLPEETEHLDLLGNSEELRKIGIIKVRKLQNLRYPLKFSFNKEAKYADLPASEYCEYQGCFYPEAPTPNELFYATQRILDSVWTVEFQVREGKKVEILSYTRENLLGYKHERELLTVKVNEDEDRNIVSITLQNEHDANNGQTYLELGTYQVTNSKYIFSYV